MDGASRHASDPAQDLVRWGLDPHGRGAHPGSADVDSARGPGVRSDWLRAIPVRYGKSPEVEVRFSQPCPRVFLWAATQGKDFRLVEDRASSHAPARTAPPLRAVVATG